MPLTRLGTEFDVTGTFGTYSLHRIANRPTPGAKAWGDYWLVSFSVPYQIDAHTKVTLGWTYTVGRNAEVKTGGSPKHANPLAAGRGAASISYGYTF